MFGRRQLLFKKSWLPGRYYEFFLAQSNALLFDTGCTICFLSNVRTKLKKYPYDVIICRVFVHNEE